MVYNMRPYTGEVDRQRVLAFRRACTTPENMNDYPTVTDMQELLDPLVIGAGERDTVRLWEDDRGELQAFAILHFPYCNLYFYVQPCAQDEEIARQIIDWGTDRVRAFGQARGQRVMLDTNCRNTDKARLALLEGSGFTRQEAYTLRMTCSLLATLSSFRLPHGYMLGHVAGEHEVESYVALHRAAFGTENMTVEARLATMRNPDYIPELDLVAVAPDGTLAAFCFCQVYREANALNRRAGGEIATIGTIPALRHKGLGRTMLRAGMHALQARGIATAVLGTSSENASAQSLFLAEGFHIAEEIFWYSKSVDPA
ncbi:MAG: GNAT family N-acetyltransferase [Chloroflexota bacterium]|nr:GNAT family N-acetyltransferase [Chloroflexota bacterium]